MKKKKKKMGIGTTNMNKILRFLYLFLSFHLSRLRNGPGQPFPLGSGPRQEREGSGAWRPLP
jgi:hypothetical protein